MTEFTVVRPRRLSSDAADQMLQLVRSRRLPPGTKLPPERELMVKLGVSRNSLREAVRILETMGVLRVEPGRGTWVREDFAEPRLDFGGDWLSSHAQDVSDLLEMRETLEIRAAELAAERGSPEQIRTIGDMFDRLKEAVATKDVDAVIAADTAFHQAVAEAAGNRILSHALNDLADLVLDTRRAVTGIPGRLRRAATEHQAIADAIVSHDPAAAGRAMRTHVRRVIEEMQAATAGAGTQRPADPENGGDSGRSHPASGGSSNNERGGG